MRLLDASIAVTAVVRSEGRLPSSVRGHALLTTVIAPGGLLELSDAEVTEIMRGADAVVSCLGHNLTFSGLFGKPRMLCRDTVRRVCEVAHRLQPPSPIKVVVVSTEGVDRPDGSDPRRGLGERLVLAILWLLLPPVADNVGVVDYLAHEATANPHVEFCAPRPSDMRDGAAGAFTLHATLQNGIFNAGATTRANVGQFMADCISKAAVWQVWKNSFPQILDVPVAAHTKAA